MLEQFFPHGVTHYIVGGLLIGAAVSLLFVTTGLVGGTSTFFSSTWSYVSKRPFFQQPPLVAGRGWRVVYSSGMILGAAIYLSTLGESFQTQVGWWQLLSGGFLIGFGARLAKGCTAGHGICGLAFLQLPSLLAVVTFLTTAIGVAHWVGGPGGQ